MRALDWGCCSISLINDLKLEEYGLHKVLVILKKENYWGMHIFMPTSGDVFSIKINL